MKEENKDNYQQAQVSLPQPAFMNTPAPVNMNAFAQQQPAQQSMPTNDKNSNPLATANQLAMLQPPGVAAAFQASSAASQFAAGFAAATALSHQQFRTILGQALAAATQIPPAQSIYRKKNLRCMEALESSS